MAPKSQSQTVQTVKRKARAFTRKHPRKSIATMVAMVFGMGCSTFPLGSAVRLVCGVAETAVKVIEVTADSGAHRDVDASVASADSTR